MAMIIQTVDGVVTNKFDITPPALTFGRTGDNQVQIDDLAVSNTHAQIICETNDKNEDHVLSCRSRQHQRLIYNEKKRGQTTAASQG